MDGRDPENTRVFHFHRSETHGVTSRNALDGRDPDSTRAFHFHRSDTHGTTSANAMDVPRTWPGRART